MPRKEVFHVRPAGRGGRFEEEWYRLSPLDLIITQHYNSYALVFKIEEDSDKSSIVETIKQALGATITQCRHIAGTIEANEHGDFSIVHKPEESAVQLVVQWLDGPEDGYLSYSGLEEAHFCGASLGDPAVLSVQGMAMSSEASPHTSPAVAGMQLTLVPGGIILAVSVHHFAMDVTGTRGLVRQLAAHCYALHHGTSAPSWDARLMDRSRFIPPDVPDEAMVDGPPSPPAHPAWLPCAWLLFHITQSKVVELKQSVRPDDGSWISTYDALSAFLWRVLSKHRAQIYNPSLASPAIFLESVNMRKRLSPPVPTPYQGNVLCGGLSFTQEQQLTLAEVISEAPLSRLASFIRKITNGVTADVLEATLAAAAPVRDKSSLHVRLDSIAPMSLAVTDWREADMCAADFGFGHPVVLRQLADKVVENMLIIYPRRWAPAGHPDPGLEVVVPFEKHAVDVLIRDPDMAEFFTFRGIEAGGPATIGEN